MAKSDTQHQGEFAIITGASSGIGLELARLCAEDGMRLLIAADEPAIEDVRAELASAGCQVEAIQVDLATRQGVALLVQHARAVGAVDHLIANAGHGLGHAFLDERIEDIDHVIDTNVRGTIWLLHELMRDMRDAGRGKVQSLKRRSTRLS